jgi:hypothetical protein
MKITKIYLTILLSISLYADIFEQNCLKCHNSSELNGFIKAYTLKYSSEDKIKDGLYRFLRNPTSNMPLMTYDFIIKKGYKKDSLLTDDMLKEAIKIYYDKYNIKRRIR